MSLREFVAYQPTCDAEGCRWVLEGDVEYWFKTAEEAAEMWRESEGWTDGAVWMCYEHIAGSHPYLGDGSECDRCGIEPEYHEVHLAVAP